jgi:hypothetical protein
MTNDKDFADLAKQGSSGAMVEFWYFLRHNKKWWLTPIVLVMVVLSLLIFLAATGAAPLIYTLF